MLREQLDQATAANQSLTSDIHKLTQDWQAAREELDIREREWRDEEQVILRESCDISAPASVMVLKQYV
jgi:rootletin